jgi:hypothetical protein
MRITLSVTLCIAAAYLQGCSDTTKAAAPNSKEKPKQVVAKNEQGGEAADNGGDLGEQGSGKDVGKGKNKDEVSQREDDGEIQEEEEQVSISPPAVPDYVLTPASGSVDISLVSKQALIMPMRHKFLADRRALLQKLANPKAKIGVLEIIPNVWENENKLVALEKRIMQDREADELHMKRFTKVIESLENMMSRYQKELREKLSELDELKNSKTKKSANHKKAIKLAEGGVSQARTHIELIRKAIKPFEKHIANM